MMSKFLILIVYIRVSNAILSFNDINLILSRSLEVSQCISKCSKFNKNENMNDSGDVDMHKSCMGMCMDTKMCRLIFYALLHNSMCIC